MWPLPVRGVCTRGENGSRLHDMPRKAVVKARCALCGAKEVSEPRGEEKYCRDCWDKKIAVEEIVAREFALKRYIRAHSAEKYLIYHSTLKRPCGQLIDVDAAEVIEPWGGGKWHMEIFRSVNPEPEDWNGEM